MAIHHQLKYRLHPHLVKRRFITAPPTTALRGCTDAVATAITPLVQHAPCYRRPRCNLAVVDGGAPQSLRASMQLAAVSCRAAVLQPCCRAATTKLQ
uniref:Predicted protein n=1 Tax=Hordeum vulgare subsp. vulgare TaxID=112509 RepID=F2D7M1_HORVV|nr:predicted protein [Hordeum vulgare subsp. vulgare]